MTVDEKIAREKRLAIGYRNDIQIMKNIGADISSIISLTRKAEYHEQLAEQLEELKAYRTLDKTNFLDGYNKAIDDFAEKLKKENKETMPTHSGFCRMSFGEVVDEIAEQLKAGVDSGTD